MVAGIDLVGEVVEGAGPHKAGDTVLVNGWGVGTDHWGGYAGEARLRPDWALPLPGGLTALQAAQLGTAGYTALLCVAALRRAGVEPASGPVLVTGTPGGVGSVATLLLAQLGYTVTAVAGPGGSGADYLRGLGAVELLDREALAGQPKPLGRETYAGAVDSCGGGVLSNVLPLVKHSGCVAACGLAAGMPLTTTVAPFILRGVTLAGIDSVFQPVEKRLAAYTGVQQYTAMISISYRYCNSLKYPCDECRVRAGGGAPPPPHCRAGEYGRAGRSPGPCQAGKTQHQLSIYILDSTVQMLEGSITGRYVVDLNM